jgi:hypothetical protein
MGRDQAVLDNKTAVKSQGLDLGGFAEEKNMIDGRRVQARRDVDMGVRSAELGDLPQKYSRVLNMFQDFAHDDTRVRVAAIRELQEIGFLDLDVRSGLNLVMAHDVVAQRYARRTDVDADHAGEVSQRGRAAKVVAMAGTDFQICAAQSFGERAYKEIVHGRVVRP